MTDDHLAELRRLCEAATPGPWQWIEHKLNERIRKRSKAGKRSRKQFVFMLAGPLRWGIKEEFADEYDYHTVFSLRWYQVKGSMFISPGWKPEDMEFVAAARTALPELLDEVERLQRERDEARAEAERWRRAHDTLARDLRGLRQDYLALQHERDLLRKHVEALEQGGGQRRATLRDVIRASEELGLYDEPQGGGG